MMRKAVLQNCMALDIHTTSQGGPWALIQTECCIYIPGESSNATYLVTHMKNQIAALNDPLPSCGDLLGRGFGARSSWLKSLLVTLVMLLAVLFVICLFYKIDDFCITWCITRLLVKLMIAKHLDSRLLRVPWTARRSNQSVLKEISPENSLEGLMLELKLQYFGHLMWRTDSLE